MPRSKSSEGPGAPRPERNRSSRRAFLTGGISVFAGAAAAQLLPQAPASGQQAAPAQAAHNLSAAYETGRPILLKNGTLYTVNWQTGDFERGDLLIVGKKIAGMGRNVEAPKSALAIDVTGHIVMPGFVDTHHHQAESLLRGILADGLYRSDPAAPRNNYASVVETRFLPVYTPDDARIAELLASLSQLNDGVTTSIDTSSVHHSPEHTDACIAGIQASGRRTVFAYSGNSSAQNFPSELTRLRKQYFASSDQLLTLAAAGTTPEQWQFARALNAPIVFHVTGGPDSNLNAFAGAGLMGHDCIYIHCTNLTSELWDRIADSGGRISISPATEMSMQQGTPAIQQTLDRALGPSLGSDVECSMTADMFTLMRSALTLQHGLANQRSATAGNSAPVRLVTCREVIEFATVYGASVAQLFPKIGQLQVGKEADIVLLATNRLNTFPLNNVPGAIATLMGPANVEGVFVAGKVRKWGGQLTGVDLSRLKADVERACDGLLARARYPRDLFGSCCVEVPGLNVPRG